jgi:curved DNA-binding protein CbpA
MSKKKRKQRKAPEIKKEIPLQDDPYWKVSGIYMDAHRVGRFLSKFERFDHEHPLWTEELLDGTPTFYSVLGTARGATKDEIQKAFAEKMRFSSYSRDVINEAFEVLSDPKLQKEYDELLLIFEQITKCMPAAEKNELIRNHDACLRAEKDFIRMGQLLPKYKEYLNLNVHGLPDLYEMIGLTKNSSFEEIKSKCETGSELFKRIFTILGEKASREEYDFVMYFNQKYSNKMQLEESNRKRRRWESIDRKVFERIVFAALSGTDEGEKFRERVFEIFKDNQDWVKYLPPNKETFFSILGLDISSLSDDKKEIEKTLRDKYRNLEKTPQVNLAYSVLKNASQRNDYMLLFKNVELLNAYKKILLDEKDEETEVLSPEMMQKGKMKKSKKKKIPHDQMTFEDFEKIIMNFLKKYVH